MRIRTVPTTMNVKILSLAVALLAPLSSPIADIPDRPEKLAFPPLTFVSRLSTLLPPGVRVEHVVCRPRALLQASAS